MASSSRPAFLVSLVTRIIAFERTHLPMGSFGMNFFNPTNERKRETREYR